MKRITARADLTTLEHELGVRPDWHEPDEQDVTVEVHGNNFDNAGFWPVGTPTGIVEQHVIIKQAGKPVAVVNLATLFAWAAGLERPKWSDLAAEFDRLHAQSHEKTTEIGR